MITRIGNPAEYYIKYYLIGSGRFAARVFNCILSKLFTTVNLILF